MNLLFTPPHNPNGLTDVLQILAFTSFRAQEKFIKAFAFGIKTFPEQDQYFDKGAAFIIRAVPELKEGVTGSFEPVIRCGVSGDLIWSGTNVQTNKQALLDAIKYLYLDHGFNDINKFFEESVYSPIRNYFVIEGLKELQEKVK